jgi:hypothetical protein
MKRIDQYKAKLKAAKATLKIRQRNFNIVSRDLIKTIDSIEILERKIEDANDKKLATITSNIKSNDRTGSVGDAQRRTPRPPQGVYSRAPSHEV